MLNLGYVKEELETNLDKVSNLDKLSGADFEKLRLKLEHFQIAMSQLLNLVFQDLNQIGYYEVDVAAVKPVTVDVLQFESSWQKSIDFLMLEQKKLHDKVEEHTLTSNQLIDRAQTLCNYWADFKEQVVNYARAKAKQLAKDAVDFKLSENLTPWIGGVK